MHRRSALTPSSRSKKKVHRIHHCSQVQHCCDASLFAERPGELSCCRRNKTCFSGGFPPLLWKEGWGQGRPKIISSHYPECFAHRSCVEQEGWNQSSVGTKCDKTYLSLWTQTQSLTVFSHKPKGTWGLNLASTPSLPIARRNLSWKEAAGIFQGLHQCDLPIILWLFARFRWSLAGINQWKQNAGFPLKCTTPKKCQMWVLEDTAHMLSTCHSSVCQKMSQCIGAAADY